MSPNTFVEDYRKELNRTGYPFAAYMPLQTDTGYSFALTTIEDASIYCETVTKIPAFSAIEKSEKQITFTVGDYQGSFKLDAVPEVLSLYTAAGVFGGIFVLNIPRVQLLAGWKDGRHTFTHSLSFCPRCLEIVPPVGVQRIVPDQGDILSGEVVIAGGYGTTLRLCESAAGVTHIEVHCVGDPTYTVSSSVQPVRHIVCSDPWGTEIVLSGDEAQTVSIVASNAAALVHDEFYSVEEVLQDALRIEGFDHTIRVSLGGK
jgi:hypothetical protein